MIRRFLFSRIKSFQYAFAGLAFVIKTQRNAWIHMLATITVVLLSLWLQLDLVSWAVIILTIGIVWLAEIFNTSLEALVDLVSPQRNSHAKICKDVAAGAVLATSIIAIVIGILILGFPLWTRVNQFITPR